MPLSRSRATTSTRPHEVELDCRSKVRGLVLVLRRALLIYSAAAVRLRANFTSIPPDLLGAIFLLIVGAGAWSLDARVGPNRL